jgi:hypothetical protein
MQTRVSAALVALPTKPRALYRFFGSWLGAA